MFTGIIEATGEVVAIKLEGGNKQFKIGSLISHELTVDQSISHNGICLTVVGVGSNFHWVVAVQETLSKSTADSWQEGDTINLERCMVANSRLEGHIVQGHIDQTGTCKSVKEQDGSWLFHFEYDPAFGNITVEKGSVAVNGVSLTCFNSGANDFTVAIIPYTYEHTNFHKIRAGDLVNIEFDIIGKYIQKMVRR